MKLQGYVDADFASDIDNKKSTTRFVFTLGGTAISWVSNLQKIVTLSTTKDCLIRMMTRPEIMLCGFNGRFF